MSIIVSCDNKGCFKSQEALLDTEKDQKTENINHQKKVLRQKHIFIHRVKKYNVKDMNHSH